MEAKILKILSDDNSAKGIPKIYCSGREGDNNFMVMELLGPNLENIFDCCKRKFSLKTSMILGKQIVKLVLMLRFNILNIFIPKTIFIVI